MSEKQSAKLDLRSAKNLANLKRYRGGGVKKHPKYFTLNLILFVEYASPPKQPELWCKLPALSVNTIKTLELAD